MSICVKPGQRGIIGTAERRLKLWITNSIGIMFLLEHRMLQSVNWEFQ